MLRLSKVFKNYRETGSLNERINLYGFIGPHAFLTKTGEVGVILEVRGMDMNAWAPGALRLPARSQPSFKENNLFGLPLTSWGRK